MKKIIYQLAVRLVAAYERPTKTEEAFMCAEEMNKMDRFIIENHLIDCGDQISNEDIRKYGIYKYARIWSSLIKLKKTVLKSH